MRRPARIFACCAALMCAALAASYPSASRAIDGVQGFETTYRVTYSGFELGDFTTRARFDGQNYSIKGNGQFRILEGLLLNWKGAISTTGQVLDDGPRPSGFVFNASSGRKSDNLRINYSGQAVTGVDFTPYWEPEPGTVPVRKSQLTGALDPLSAVFLLGRTQGGASGASLCTRKIPVFDGRMRYDLVLSHRKTVNVKNEGLARYTGPVVVCRVKYAPVSGHLKDHAGTIHLAKSPDIEVWLVPLPNASLYVPYAIHLPTLGGGFASATAISFKSTLTPKRQAMEETGAAR